MNNLLRDQLLTNPKTFLRSIPFMKVSEGIAIGAVTGLGYFSAYLSDVSYKAYFGLPALYASVGLNAIILSIFAFVIMSLVLLAFAIPDRGPVWKMGFTRFFARGGGIYARVAVGF